MNLAHDATQDLTMNRALTQSFQMLGTFLDLCGSQLAVQFFV